MFWFLIITFAVIVIFSVLNRLNHWKNKGVPQYSLGNALLNITFFLNPKMGVVENFNYMYYSFPDKRFAGVYQMLKPILLLRDPELIKQITIKDFEYFTDHQDILSDDGEPIWKRNLFALKGDTWRDMRATLSPSFTSSKLKMIFSLIAACAKQFVDHFDQKNNSVTEVDIKDVFSRFTNDVIATSAFGVSCNSLKHQDNEFYEMGKKIFNFERFWTSIKIVLLMGLPKKIASLLNLNLFDKDVVTFFTKILEENIKSREVHGIIRPDMIHLLLEAKRNRLNDVTKETHTTLDENNYKNDQSNSTVSKRLLTDEDIMAQAFIFFLAGFDTTASVMSFVAYEIAVNEDVHRRLQEEIDDIYEQCQGNLTYEYLAKMKYMDMVITETLRLYPVAFAIDRVCVKPYMLKDDVNQTSVQLNVGDVLFIPVFCIHRDPQYYPEPTKFSPERFSEENKQNMDSKLYLPFGSGPRHCVGNRFALMEIKMLFFFILQKFDIVPVDKTLIPMKLSKSKVRLSTERNIVLGFQKRKINV